MVPNFYKLFAIIALIYLCNYGRAEKTSEDGEEETWAMELLTNLSSEMKEQKEKLTKMKEQNEILNNKLDSLQQDLSTLKDLLLREINLLHGNVEADPVNNKTEHITVQAVQKISPKYPRNCDEALQSNDKDGVYELYASLPDIGFTSFEAYCMRDIFNGTDWTVIQRRQDGSVDFLRGWDSYKKGFVNVSDSEFFVGLEKIHAMVINARPMRTELWIQMVDNEGAQRFAKYDNFVLSDENDKFTLKSLGEYYGNAGDSLSYHVGQSFTTIDSDNDKNPKHCAEMRAGAWWYDSCNESNLNGKYGDRDHKGINWKTFHGYTYSLKSVFMAIRPISVK